MYIKNNVQDKTLPQPQVYIVTNHFLQSTSCLTLLLLEIFPFLDPSSFHMKGMQNKIHQLVISLFASIIFFILYYKFI